MTNLMHFNGEDPETEHLLDEDIAWYLDRALTADETARVELHLAACSDCRSAVEEVRDAVIAEAANPARLKKAVAQMIASYGRPRLADTDSAEPPAMIAAKVPDSLGDVVERWLGTLAAWSLQPAVADVPLAVGSQPTHAGVQADLESLFQPAVLQGALAWAAGPLVVNAIYDEEGLIRSLRGAVGAQPGRTGLAIILELTDGDGHRTALRLTPDRPFDVRRTPGVRGRLEGLALRVLTQEAA